MRRIRSILFFLSVAALAPAMSVEPCCMVPKTYKRTIQQSAQEAVLFHHSGREELILRINYEINGDKMPDRFAWIVTVPNEPDAYAVADAKLFKEVFEWAQPLVEIPTKGRSLGEEQGGLEFGELARVGPYEIQPVRALGKEALAGLNQWLAKNGFPTEDPKHMEYFVENRFTFLCIKVVPQKGKKAVESSGGVPPLHLSFKSKHPYYPLRFSSRQGVFDVNLYVFTRKQFDYKASSDSLSRINWSAGSRIKNNVPVFTRTFPAHLKQAYGKTKFRGYRGKWYLNVLRTHGVNKGNSIAGWKEDIFFKTRG